MSSPPPATDPLQSAREQLEAGDPQQAENWARLAVEQQPFRPEAWCMLAKLLETSGQLGDAVEAYGKVAALDPADLGSRTALGHLFRRMSFPEEAIHWHGEALALQPDSLILQLNHRFVLPVVPTSAAQLEQLRTRCLEGLEELQQCRQSWSYGVHDMSHHAFPLIYHNRDDRAALESYGDLIGRYVQDRLINGSNLVEARPGGQRNRLRIGFLSGFFYDHSNSLAFEGLIRHLDRRRFEVVVIHLHTSDHDHVRARIDSFADRHLTLSNHYNEARQTLLALQLDLLFYTDIGMHPMPTLLASTRLAPVQVAGWGIPQTSGLKTVDHYISGRLVEPENAQAQYTEHLVQLPGLPCCYLSDNLIHSHRRRDYFFLPEPAPLFGCLQSLWKLHPDFDALLEQIAQQLPEAWFVFVESEITSLTALFMERLAQAAPTACQRLILLSRQQRDDFIALASCLDVLLDPPYFSSGITLYDTIHSGTPTVCLEGRFLRNRYVAGAYRLMGLDDPPVAHSPEEYVALAVCLGRDRKRLLRLRREIQDKSAHLYDRIEVVEAFSAFAQEAVAAARQRQT